MTQGREYLCVDFSAKDHLCQVERVVVSNPAAADHRLSDAEFLGEFVKLLAASMYHAHPYTDLMKQSELFGKRHQVVFVLGYLAGKLYDKSLALKFLNIRKRLPQEVQ